MENILINTKCIWYVWRLGIAFAIFILSISMVEAKTYDHGVISNSYEISEEDLIEVIQVKLANISESKMMEYNDRVIERTKKTIERPRKVEGIEKVKENNSFLVDMSVKISKDIEDVNGNLIVKKGTIINPLQTISLDQDLLFFNGDDKEQVNYVSNLIKHYKEPDNRNRKLKLILVQGNPIELTKKFKQNVYFDQAGYITSKLHITKVPSLVTQDGLNLKVKEIKIEKTI
jgi:conjugal transfer pilus assembly protein TraW